MKIDHRILIVGMARSGTTLTQQLLASHPVFFSPPETHYFQFLLRVDLRKYTDYIFVPSQRFMKFINYNNQKIVSIDESLNIPSNTKTAVEYFVSTMDYNASLHNKKGWIEKTPGHILHIDRIEKYYQDIKFIHILRNPKNILASLVDVARKYPEKWVDYTDIERTISEIESILKISEQYSKNPNHLLIEFDKFLKNTHSTLTHMAHFCGIDASGEIIDTMTKEYKSNNLFRNDEKWKTGYGDKLDSNRKSKFDTIFTKEEKNTIVNKLEASQSMYEKLLCEAVPSN